MVLDAYCIGGDTSGSWGRNRNLVHVGQTWESESTSTSPYTFS